MSKPSHKDTILTKGLHVIHERGFSNASVRDITVAANVPNGSFTNHFASKEEFGLAVLERYVEQAAELMERTLLNETRKPLERLMSYIDISINALGNNGVAKGCMIGNFGIEMGQHSDVIRVRVAEIFNYRCSVMAGCVQAAINAGELSPDLNSQDIGEFITGSLQGATLLAKSAQSMQPMHTFRRTLVSTVLRPL